MSQTDLKLHMCANLPANSFSHLESIIRCMPTPIYLQNTYFDTRIFNNDSCIGHWGRARMTLSPHLQLMRRACLTFPRWSRNSPHTLPLQPTHLCFRSLKRRLWMQWGAQANTPKDFSKRQWLGAPKPCILIESLECLGDDWWVSSKFCRSHEAIIWLPTQNCLLINVAKRWNCNETSE